MLYMQGARLQLALQYTQSIGTVGKRVGNMASAARVDTEALAALDRVELGWRHKAIPADFHGLTARALAAGGARLGDFQTPLLALGREELTANLHRLAAWCAARGVLLAPHGKTTMAPQLWAEQIAAGAWGISLANSAQLRVARHFGVSRVQVANSLTDPLAIRWLAATQGPEFEVISWVDSVQTVDLIERELAASAALHPGQPPVFSVLVELGAPGGRTGARGADAALDVARAVRESTHLRLVGIAGYEGSLAHTADAAGLSAVREYLADLGELHARALAEDLYAPGVDLMVTAGGSAYFNDVVDVLSGVIHAGDGEAPRVDLVIRSGAYIVHDDGFYREISPFSRHADDGEPLASAMHAWARVVSVPEPGLALLDAGKRDLPVDEGLPEPQLIARRLGGTAVPLPGASISAVNDQHSFLRFDPAATAVNIGDVVRLGLSHPCTAFDKWTLIPVFSGDARNPSLESLVHTFF